MVLFVNEVGVEKSVVKTGTGVLASLVLNVGHYCG